MDALVLSALNYIRRIQPRDLSTMDVASLAQDIRAAAGRLPDTQLAEAVSLLNAEIRNEWWSWLPEDKERLISLLEGTANYPSGW